MWHLVVFSVAMTASDLAKPTPPAPGPPGGSFFGITSPPLIWLAYLAVTVGVGALSYEYLEKPSRMWLRQVLSPKKAKASEVF
jgi:peptidoglycan/LPS O-acetylase OafA/YrhL